MDANQVVKSVCGLCSACCGVLITLEDGKPVEIKGDPESPPNRGGLCKIGLASLEYLYHPDRLKHPVKRSGERGEGKWQQISWDEALSLAARALNKAKKDYGPESVVMVHGSAKGFMDTHLVRLVLTQEWLFLAMPGGFRKEGKKNYMVGHIQTTIC